MAEKSRRQVLLERMVARLQQITIANGFQTDAGALVLLNETPALGPDDPETAIAVVIDEDIVGYQGEQITVTLPLDIQALARADLDAPWEAVEAVIADIKRAVELADRTFNRLTSGRVERGSTRTVPREEGMTTVGASVRYIVPISETWGQP